MIPNNVNTGYNVNAARYQDPGNGTLQANAPAPPPAQTPSEFARSLADGLKAANQTLDRLRFRLFQDSEENDPNVPAESPDAKPPLLPTLARAHWELSHALVQLEDICDRL